MGRPREFDPALAVEQALQAFWESGLAATSVDQLQQATGLSRSSMYQGVGNRDEWLRLAVDRYVERLTAEFEQLFRDCGADQAVQRLLLDAADDNFAGKGCLLANGIAQLHADDSSNLDIVRQGFARLADTLTGLLRPGMPSERDARARCVELLCALSGLRTLQRAGVPRKSLVAAAHRLAGLLNAR